MRPIPLLAITTGLLFGSLFWLGSACAIEPSFDCNKADHDAEDLICKDDEISALDNQLAGVYAASLENIPADERKNLKAMQRGWIKGRNDCWKSRDLRDCVKFAYESRITELQIQGGLVSVPEPVQYQCNSGDYDYLTAIFYRSTVLSVVALTRINDRETWQVIAYHSRSGSGAKYEGQNVLFWSKGNEAMLEWNGEQLKCREIPVEK